MADETTRARERSSEGIRQEIERTRSRMDETVDELGQRMSPGRFVDEAWHRIRDGGDDGVASTFKEHAVPFALMGLGLGWLAIEQATGTSVTDRRSRSRVPPGTRAPAEGRRGPYRGDAVDHDDPDWEHADTGTRLKAKASGMRDEASEAAGTAADAADKTSAAASSAKEKTKRAIRSAGNEISGAASATAETAGSAKDSAAKAARSAGETSARTARSARDSTRGAARATKEGVRSAARATGQGASRAADATKSRLSSTASSTREGFETAMEERPLAMGALAFGVGLVGGLVAPSTSAEDRLMGRPADTLKEETGRMARETGRKAGRVAGEAAGTVAEETRAQAEKHDVEGRAEHVKDSAERTVEKAGETAREAVEETAEAAREVAEAADRAVKDRAKDEDLTPDELEARAREAGERTKEAAGEERTKKTPGSDEKAVGSDPTGEGS